MSKSIQAARLYVPLSNDHVSSSISNRQSRSNGPFFAWAVYLIFCLISDPVTKLLTIGHFRITSGLVFEASLGAHPFICKTIFVHTQIGHVRYINIQAWLRGFRVKIANFSSFFCLSIPTGDLDTKKTTPNIDVRPESLGPMLEY